MPLGLPHHRLHLLGTQSAVLGGYHYPPRARRREVLRCDFEQTVRVDLERYPHLDPAPGGRGEVRHLGQSQQVVVIGATPLALVNVDCHIRLTVLDGVNVLRAVVGYCRGALDDHVHQPAAGVGAETVDEHAKLKTQLKTKQPSRPRATSTCVSRATWGPTQVSLVPD